MNWGSWRRQPLLTEIECKRMAVRFKQEMEFFSAQMRDGSISQEHKLEVEHLVQEYRRSLLRQSGSRHRWQSDQLLITATGGLEFGPPEHEFPTSRGQISTTVTLSVLLPKSMRQQMVEDWLGDLAATSGRCRRWRLVISFGHAVVGLWMVERTPSAVRRAP